MGIRCLASRSRYGICTVLKPVPGSGSRAKCAQFRGSSDAKHVSSWFQPWATLWPTCHMLVPASLLQSVECSTECKNSIFHCTIGCNKYKSSLASGAVAPPWTPASCLGPCCASTWHGLPQKSLVPEALFKSSSGSRGGCGTGFRTLNMPGQCITHALNKIFLHFTCGRFLTF